MFDCLTFSLNDLYLNHDLYAFIKGWGKSESWTVYSAIPMYSATKIPITEAM